ncbi:uncharacterized protein [Montipora foliosa]|uniref:uncharacterized protein n=1 Tax=Montipora foliosa TaxID=591990 RepID=UPI0035F0FD13
MVIITVSIAVSVVSLVSFRCFDGSFGFVPVFRWFRFGVSGFSTCRCLRRPCSQPCSSLRSLVQAAVDVMGFATEYRDIIIFVYYCVNVGLAISIFAFGTLYLRYRDRRDQQRKEDRDRRDQQRKEWRDFAETIRRERNELKSKNIPWKISEVKNAFGKIQIYKDIKGTDVLRFMMRDPDYKRFKTKQLDALREDLDSAFPLLSRCASLILLGTVPENIRAELGRLVTDLVELTLPFYKGEERVDTILKCLEHFGHYGSDKKKEESRRSNVDERLETDIPYVRQLRFGDWQAAINYKPFSKTAMNYEHCSKEAINYDQCSKFTFQSMFQSPSLWEVQDDQCQQRGFLQKIQNDLDTEKYMSDIAKELRQQAYNLNFIDKIDSGDRDELVVVKVLHEIRNYIHFIEQGPLDEERNRNLETLKDIHERVTKVGLDEVIVRDTGRRFEEEISFLMKNMQKYHKSKGFRSQFEQLYRRFQEIIVIKGNSGPLAPFSDAIVPNDQDETSV